MLAINHIAIKWKESCFVSILLCFLFKKDAIKEITLINELCDFEGAFVLSGLYTESFKRQSRLRENEK